MACVESHRRAPKPCAGYMTRGYADAAIRLYAAEHGVTPSDFTHGSTPTRATLEGVLAFNLVGELMSHRLPHCPTEATTLQDITDPVERRVALAHLAGRLTMSDAAFLLQAFFQGKTVPWAHVYLCVDQETFEIVPALDALPISSSSAGRFEQRCVEWLVNRLDAQNCIDQRNGETRETLLKLPKWELEEIVGDRCNLAFYSGAQRFDIAAFLAQIIPEEDAPAATLTAPHPTAVTLKETP